MTDTTELVDRYIAAWNETDGQVRRRLIAETYTAGATYVDPMLESQGQDGIDTMIRNVQERFPGHRFRRTGEVDAHHDRVRFTWELGPADGPAIVKGTDFAVVAAERLAAVTGFFDQVPAAAA